MTDFIDKVILWLDAPKVVGFFFALGTIGYLLFITKHHHTEFWEAAKGDDKQFQFIEMILVVWLVLFTSMVIADFSFGLQASERAWWSMDTVFGIGIGGKTIAVLNRNKKEKE